jgi:SAM-dependent methyltransferase
LGAWARSDMSLNSDRPSFTSSHDYPFEQEIRRIRAAYERRKREIPADRYSDANPRAVIFHRELETRIHALLERKCAGSLMEKCVLDLGCGEGRWLRRFAKWGASPGNLTGVDLLPERVGVARELCDPRVRLLCLNAADLPFADESFDIILCMTMFSSILSRGLRSAVAAEMMRVLRPGGFVLWYDFFVNNPANRDVRGVGKGEIARFFPGCRVELARITVAAPLGRAIAEIPSLYALLSGCRIFCTHYLGWICKP